MKLNDLTGKRFGRWTVIKRSENKARTRWLCRCDCGTLKSVQGSGLVTGASTSCGCFRNEQGYPERTKSVTKHGLTDSPTWNSWRAMIKRCTQESSINFHKYGGRGISICSEWMAFENFLKDMGRRPAGMSLDRIDVNGNYEPNNCRWATAKQQNRNTTCNRMLNYKGKDYCLAELAETLGISTQTISRRIEKGVPIDLPKRGGKRNA